MTRTSTWYEQLFLKEFLFFSFSTVAVNASKLLTAVFVANFAGPVHFAAWNILQPILMYGSLIMLGVPNAMNRYVPVLMGAREKSQADDWVRFAFWFTVSACIIASFFMMVLSLLDQRLPFPSNYLLSMSLLFIGFNIYNFFLFVLKSRVQFRQMSFQLIFFAALWPPACIGFAWKWGIEGFIIAQFFVYGVVSFCIYRWSGVTLAGHIRFSLMRPAIVLGFPIMLAGLLYNLMLTVDRWIILQFLGVEAVGQYTVAILIQNTLTILPQVISQQFYPRMAESYGRSGSIHALFKPVFMQSLMSLAVTLPVLVAVFLALPFAASRLLPEYSAGIEPARLILIGIAFIPVASGVANFLNTIGKQLYYLSVQAITLGVNVFLSILFIERGMGLKGVALAGSLSWICFTVLMLFAFITAIWSHNHSVSAKPIAELAKKT